MYPWHNRTGLAALPHDLLIAVYGFLDVPDALALAQTCRTLHAFAASRAAWLTLARTLAVTRALALPADKQTTAIPAELSTAEMRDAVRQTTRLASNLLKPVPTLVPTASLALPEKNTVVHASLLPGARFLLTAQHGGTFACWDLATTEPAPPPQPSLPRRRSIRTQTHSADGVDVEMGSESGEEEEPLDDSDPHGRRGLRRPRCIATWETGAEYVEFAYDLVPGGVVVALMVAVQVEPDPPILKRDMYVVRINLPGSATPPPSPSIPPAPSFIAGRNHGLTFLAHSPLRHPVFICTTFIDAAGHAGILGDIPDTMVVFVLLFDPSPTASAVRCASSLVHCGFKCEPGARYTALGTSTHVLLYAESAWKTIARRIDVKSMRRRWSASPPTTTSECVDLGIKLLGTPRHRFFTGNPGTEGAPLFSTVRVSLRRKMPKWLRRHDSAHSDVDDPEPGSSKRKGKRSSQGKRRNQPITVSALGLSVDAEGRSTDVFRGVALGSHDIEPDSESDSDESDSDSYSHSSSSSSSYSSRFRTGGPQPDSYHLPTPTQSSLLQPATEPTPAEKLQAKSLPLSRPFRRVCRVRYKRTIFPAHVNYAHELAGIGSFGRYAAWIEGDGVLEEVDWEREPLRVVVAPLEWEKGGEPGEGWNEDLERRKAGQRARVVHVEGVRNKLNLVSCLAMEDAAGVIVMATIDGQVVVGSLV
ncbi:hypothetical protein RhiJN_00353 [Ceratobasidium sp. AG-Ba]|nr:hypothetical protein RhiJN_00353 [Ceratobasidium sp. AG-Ba]QRW01382.1 hypothetical protein RhiLY_00379 [Ceratobasidium sp. AG-Ba]